jgi:hypothetical protein
MRSDAGYDTEQHIRAPVQMFLVRRLDGEDVTPQLEPLFGGRSIRFHRYPLEEPWVRGVSRGDLQ